MADLPLPTKKDPSKSNFKTDNERVNTKDSVKQQNTCSKCNFKLENAGPSSSTHQSTKEPHQKLFMEKMKAAFRQPSLSTWLESWRKARLQKQTSDQIDRGLQKQKKVYKGVQLVLVTGSSQAGKSTIIRQMSSLTSNNCIGYIGKLYRNNLIRNLLQAILSITSAMSTLTPPILFENPENEKKLSCLQYVASNTTYFYDTLIYDVIEAVWNDKGVQAAFKRRDEYEFNENAIHFFEKISTIKQFSYIPTEQDILYCHIASLGVSETFFQTKNPFTGGKSPIGHKFNTLNFHIVEVRHLNERSYKWVPYFESISALIFVAACNSYTIKRGNSEKNQLQESIELFAALWRNTFLQKTCFLLFLNKEDLLAKGILKNRSKLEEQFTGVSSYELPQYISSYEQNNESVEVLRGKYFIRDQFLRNVKCDGDRVLYTHFTCAINKDNMKGTYHSFNQLFYPTYSLL